MFDRIGWSTDVDKLIAKKSYERAIAILRDEVKSKPTSLHHRQKLADVLALAGHLRQASETLLNIVDTLSESGFWAQAIAVLKKVERIDPKRPDVAMVLADVMAERDKERAKAFRPKISSRFAAIAAAAADEEARRPRASVAGGKRPAEVAEILADLDPYLGGTGVEVPEDRLQSIQGSPLFSGLGAPEILAVMRGLRLRTFAPGDIIVTEGECRQSMFLIASGRVRVFVRRDDGSSAPVRELAVGEFFGEISMVQDTARTATATAATPCELLELGRDDFSALASQHPQVGSVVEEFYRRRAGSREERAARNEPVDSE